MSQLDENTKKEELTAESKKPGSFSIGLVEQIELIVIALADIILLFSFVFRTCRVSGPSMENTLFNNETVVISNMFYKPERNDIVVIHQTGALNEPIVKRIVGLPGETVNIEYYSDTMTVTIIDKDGYATVLKEPHIKYEGLPPYYSSSTYVEEGTVFVMGDNRNNSADSRDSRIGLVDDRRILGKVVFRVTPISRIGIVK